MGCIARKCYTDTIGLSCPACAEEELKATTPRQKAVIKALRELIPQAPYADFEPIALAARARHMRELAPRNAAFLATIAHIRHRHTEYDALRDDGYDGDSARHFVLDAINEKLSEWGSTRFVSAEESDTDMD